MQLALSDWLAQDCTTRLQPDSMRPARKAPPASARAGWPPPAPPAIDVLKFWAAQRALWPAIVTSTYPQTYPHVLWTTLPAPENRNPLLGSHGHPRPVTRAAHGHRGHRDCNRLLRSESAIGSHLLSSVPAVAFGVDAWPLFSPGMDRLPKGTLPTAFDCPAFLGRDTAPARGKCPRLVRLAPSSIRSDGIDAAGRQSHPGPDAQRLLHQWLATDCPTTDCTASCSTPPLDESGSALRVSA